MKGFINTVFTGLFILLVVLVFDLFFMWIDLSQRTELAEKRLVEVQTELYKCQQETETFTDIIVNKRWE